MSISIRSAEPRDLNAIREIYNEAVLTLTASYDYEPQAAEERAAWFDERRAAGYPVFIAEDSGGRVIGWSALGPFRGRVGYRFTAETSVYVAADCRGAGTGRLLLQALMTAARGMSLHALIAGIDSEGEASIRLHASLGFAEVGRFREVGFKFGRWLDVVFMELVLDREINS